MYQRNFAIIFLAVFVAGCGFKDFDPVTPFDRLAEAKGYYYTALNTVDGLRQQRIIDADTFANKIEPIRAAAYASLEEAERLVGVFGDEFNPDVEEALSTAHRLALTYYNLAKEYE